MRKVVYVLLSPTFGMHQYTADLANRAALKRGEERIGAFDAVTVVTTVHAPRWAYGPDVKLVTPLAARSTGFRREGLDVGGYRRTLQSILAERPSVVHFTGVHLWNAGLVYALRARGIPVVHTLHDLDPHRGVRHGGLIRLWNRVIVGSGCHVLVHGSVYRERLVGERRAGGTHPSTPPEPAAAGAQDALLRDGSAQDALLRDGSAQDALLRDGSAQDALLRDGSAQDALVRNGSAQDAWGRVTCVPLLHGFWSYETGLGLAGKGLQGDLKAAKDIVLFFGRVEQYKGVDTLLDAWRRLVYSGVVSTGIGEKYGGIPARLVVAGAVAPDATGLIEHLPEGVELRNRRIDDAEAIDLFRAAALLVLPYHDATQSALIAAAYTFGIPVIATRTGALPEYVAPDTGWMVPPADPEALAASLEAALRSSSDTRAVMQSATRAWYAERRRRETEELTAMYNSLTPLREE